MFSIKSAALKVFCSDINDIDWHSRDPLLSDEAHVYFFDISAADLLAEAYLVTRDEQAKASLFRQETDARRFLTGRIFTKKILAGRLGADPGTILIQPGENGKPFAIFNDKALQGLHFNISHSGNLVMIGVCSEPIGVDIEEMKSSGIKELSQTVFSKKEIEILESSSDPVKTFYTFWTRKEALLKLTGAGLLDNLHELEVADGTNENNLLNSEGCFDVVSFEPTQGYRASISVPSGIKIRFPEFNK